MNYEYNRVEVFKVCLKELMMRNVSNKNLKELLESIDKNSIK